MPERDGHGPDGADRRSRGRVGLRRRYELDRYRSRRWYTFRLLHFQFLDAHLRPAGDLQLVTAAAGTGVEALVHGHGFSALHAPALPGQGQDFQPGAFRNAAPGYGVEAKAQGFSFHGGKLADFKPDTGYPLEAFALSGFIYQLQYPFGEGHFVHGLFFSYSH
ncbi:protein of unknown function [Georgfuchsia toluolica]|uniref:Uncharacterized protein n=1 Tax=Georgfuchsia toluolica TaxID=424218 RepID=A0A916J3D5_9PROT|nr:protein of unknown function [Georgfuchsia toluolica]